MPDDHDIVLRVNQLTTRFRTDAGLVTAVDDVSFVVRRGETLGIVGESGCGKTVTSKSIMRLLPEHVTRIAPESEILFDGINLAHAPEKVMRTVRGNRIAMIFQEPMTSLNPVFRVGWQLEEALKYHTDLNGAQRRERVVEMLRLVEIPEPERRAREYPHQLSGGMRQRVMIAMALACDPEVLIADEPTTALDVTIQAQILALMEKLRKETGTAIVLITHDLGVVAQVCDRVMVMYAGRAIEKGTAHEIFKEPRHPYTRALLESIPKRGKKRAGAKLATIPGMVPSLMELPEGCRFEARCTKSDHDRCVREEPELIETEDGRACRCFYPLDTTAGLTVGATD
ncbi:MAG: ABC transporter ATP-binding protein [Planctomycetota bacterium]